MAYRDLNILTIKISSGFELVAVVEDLKTLRSTACVRVFAHTEDGKQLFEVFSMIEVPQ